MFANNVINVSTVSVILTTQFQSSKKFFFRKFSNFTNIYNELGEFLSFIQFSKIIGNILIFS